MFINDRNIFSNSWGGLVSSPSRTNWTHSGSWSGWLKYQSRSHSSAGRTPKMMILWKRRKDTRRKTKKIQIIWKTSITSSWTSDRMSYSFAGAVGVSPLMSALWKANRISGLHDRSISLDRSQEDSHVDLWNYSRTKCFLLHFTGRSALHLHTSLASLTCLCRRDGGIYQSGSPSHPSAIRALGFHHPPSPGDELGAYPVFNPIYDMMNDQLGEMSRQLGRKYRRVRSSFPALMFEMSSFLMPTSCALFTLEGKNGPLAGILWPERIRLGP